MGRNESVEARLSRRFAKSDEKAWTLMRRRLLVPCVIDALGAHEDLRAVLVDRRVPADVGARVRGLVAHLTVRCSDGNAKTAAFMKDRADSFVADVAHTPHRLFRRYARLVFSTDNPELHRRLRGLASRVYDAVAPAARAAAAGRHVRAARAGRCEFAAPAEMRFAGTSSTAVVREAVRALDAVQRLACRVARSSRATSRSAAVELLREWDDAPGLLQAVCTDGVAASFGAPELRVRPELPWVARRSEGSGSARAVCDVT